MIPNGVYDIVSTVNREVDLTRPALRDPYQIYRADGGQSWRSTRNGTHESTARPRLAARLIAAVRSLPGRRSRSQPAHTG